jgi:hypothetical protein
MGFKIKLVFKYNSMPDEEYDLWYTGGIEPFKKDYSYVKYEGDVFQFVMYDLGDDGYDYVAYFSKTYDQPYYISPVFLFRQHKINKCECGKAKAKDLGKHSYWCPMFEDK